MWLAIWQLSARRILTWYLPVFLLLVGYTLFVTTPLGIDLPPVIIGGLLGWVSAFRLFVHPPRVSPFVFSRPFSRTRLFLYRWAIGLLLQAFPLLVVFAIIAFGLRQIIQVRMLGSNWYPMVRWFELSTLWPAGLASILTYQTTCFVLLRSRLHGRQTLSKLRRLGNAAFLAFAGLLAVIFAIGYVAARLRQSPAGSWEFLPLPMSFGGALCISYGVLLTAATTLASLYCSRHFEVDA